MSSRFQNLKILKRTKRADYWSKSLFPNKDNFWKNHKRDCRLTWPYKQCSQLGLGTSIKCKRKINLQFLQNQRMCRDQSWCTGLWRMDTQVKTTKSSKNLIAVILSNWKNKKYAILSHLVFSSNLNGSKKER